LTAWISSASWARELYFHLLPRPHELCNQHNKQLPVYESVNVSHTPETPSQTSFLAMSRSRRRYINYTSEPRECFLPKVSMMLTLSAAAKSLHSSEQPNFPVFGGSGNHALLQNGFTQKFIYLVGANSAQWSGKMFHRNGSVGHLNSKLLHTLKHFCR